MKLKDLISEYGEYEVYETKGESCDGSYIMLGLEKPKPKTVWELKDGDNYWVIDSDGNVPSCYKWIEYCCCDEREVGNVFLTREEALQDLERRKVETLLLKHGGRRWFKNREYNYFLRDDDHLGNNFWIDELRVSPVQGVIYFDTKEQAEKAIAEIGADRIKKALLEVR